MEVDTLNKETENKRVRDKTKTEKIKNMDEQTRNHIKQMKICILEEDEVGFKEEKQEDSDFEEDSSEEERKKKKMRAAKRTAADNLHYGKLNLVSYFLFDKDDVDDVFPNYHSIVVQQKYRSDIKICNVCYNFAEYTCPKCLDKYCSRFCFKTHVEMKCIKYLDI